MFCHINVLFPCCGVFQIVEDRFLAGGSFLLALHPNDCVFHAKKMDKLKG